MRIGIVLAAIPGYSETFFKSKIQFLQETEGMEVVLFVDHQTTPSTWNACKVVHAAAISDHIFLKSLQFGYQLLKATVSEPIKIVKLYRLNVKSGFTFGINVRSLVNSSHLMGSKVDWIHFGFGTLAIGRENVARVIGAKMAISFRGFDHYIFPLKRPDCYRNVFQRTDKFHVLSQGMQRNLVEQGIKAGKIKVITPAINASKFQPEIHPKKSSVKKVRLVTVARLHWIKGLEYTLEALALFKEKGHDFQYTIIGEGQERERLMFAVHQLGLQQQVILAGKLSPDHVIMHLKESDLYIQYSIQEGFCNAVLEAQAMGLLCIVSDAEGLSENVVHEKTGWVVAKGQPEMLATKMAEVVRKDEEELTKIRTEAIRRVSEDFNLQKQKASFLEFYKG